MPSRAISRSTARRRGWIALVIVLLALLPLVLPRYHLLVFGRALALCIACLGVNVLLGYTGLLSLGHAAYFGIGAYAGGFLFTFGHVTSIEAYLVAGLLASTALAALVGILCVRTTRIYFTMLTLAFAQAVRQWRRVSPVRRAWERLLSHRRRWALSPAVHHGRP